MLDDLGLKIIARSIDEKIDRVRQDTDASEREQRAAQRDAADAKQYLAAQNPAFTVPQSFESVATRLQKYAAAGLEEKDAVLAGVSSALESDGFSMTEGIQNKILMHAATSLISASSPLPHIALALLYGDD